MGFSIRKVLVHYGSSINIYPLRTTQELGIKKKHIEPTIISIVGFDGHAQTPVDKVALPISMHPQDDELMVELHIIDVETTYKDPFAKCNSLDIAVDGSMVQRKNSIYNLCKGPTSASYSLDARSQRPRGKYVEVRDSGRRKANPNLVHY